MRTESHTATALGSRSDSMTVKELIEALAREPDKGKVVRVFPVDMPNGYYGEDTLNISDIDYSIKDRLDINCCSDYGRSI